MRFYWVVTLLLVPLVAGFANLPAAAQTPPEAYARAWHNWGVLPFSAVDIAVVEAGGRYVMYFTGQAAGVPRPQRAFSVDLRNWSVDDRDFCSATGLCAPPDQASALGHRPIVRLPDGRYRLFRKSGSDIVSFVSNDAMAWTREAGVRFTRDSATVWERGSRTLVGLAFMPLSDGRLRMYYAGALLPGSDGTDAAHANCGGCMGVLSAVSTDNGLTFVREAGVRVDPTLLGPIVPTGQFHVIGHSVVAVANGYRLYTTSWIDGAVSYFSSDGLAFTFEGQIPAIGSDIATVSMSDGRLWLVSSTLATEGHAGGCPQGCDLDTNDRLYEVGQMMVLGAAPFSLTSARWNGSRQSATFEVSGQLVEPVRLNPIVAKSLCETTPDRPWCAWHPEYYALSAATSGQPAATATYTGPLTRPDRTRDYTIVFEAVAGETRVLTAAYCMTTPGFGVTSVCQ